MRRIYEILFTEADFLSNVRKANFSFAYLVRFHAMRENSFDCRGETIKTTIGVPHIIAWQRQKTFNDALESKHPFMALMTNIHIQLQIK